MAKLLHAADYVFYTGTSTQDISEPNSIASIDATASAASPAFRSIIIVIVVTHESDSLTLIQLITRINCIFCAINS